jgi:hypothetical protein
VTVVFVIVRSSTVTGPIKTLKHYMNIVTERSSSYPLANPQALYVIEPSWAFKRRHSVVWESVELYTNERAQYKTSWW